MNKGKKISGGKYIKNRKKKRYELPGQNIIARLSESEKEKRKTKRVRGGNVKIAILQAKIVYISQKGKTKKATIKNVAETPSNRFLARQNIITKGTIVETDMGKVRITNRPTQDGVLNGILIK